MSGLTSATAEPAIVAVAVETSGSNPVLHHAVEVSWWNLATGERETFIPQHNPHSVLAGAELRVLRDNRYLDRLAEAPQAAEGVVNRFFQQFVGPGYWENRGDDPWLTSPTDERRKHSAATLLVSAPTWTPMFLEKLPRRADRGYDTEPFGRPWCDGIWDIEVYAAGVLGWTSSRLPGLSQICNMLGVKPGDHTAADDVRAVVECFERLRDIVADREEMS